MLKQASVQLLHGQMMLDIGIVDTFAAGSKYWLTLAGRSVYWVLLADKILFCRTVNISVGRVLFFKEPICPYETTRFIVQFVALI